MMLSKFFSLNEMTKSRTATRLGIDNQPTEFHIKRMTALCQRVLDPVREHYGVPFSPSSGYRDLDLNSAIGGAKGSQHVLGEAADIEVPGVSNYELAKWIEINLDYDQLILEFYNASEPDSGWVHVSYKEKGNRKQALSYINGNYINGIDISQDRLSSRAAPSSSDVRKGGLVVSLLNFFATLCRKEKTND